MSGFVNQFIPVVKFLKYTTALKVIVLLLGIICIISYSSYAKGKSLPLPSPVRPNLILSDSFQAERALGSYLAAIYATNRNDQKIASKYLFNALASDPNNTHLLQNTITALVTIGDVSSALPLAARLIEVQPNNNFARLVLAVGMLAKKDFDLAKGQITKLSLDGIYGLLVPLMKAWAECGKENFIAALDSMAPLKNRKIYKPYLYFHSAMINDLSENLIEAENYYLQTEKTSIGQTHRWVMSYGAFLERNNRQKDAFLLYKSRLDSDPTSSWLKEAIKKLNSSLNFSNEIRDYRDGLAEVFFGIASLLPQSSGHTNTLVYARLALHLRKDFGSAYMLLGEVYESLNHPKYAVLEYEKVSENSVFSWSAKLRKALMLAELEHIDQAAKILRPMIDQRANHTDAPEILGDVLRFDERYHEAIKAYDIAVSRVSDFQSYHWRLLYSRGVALEQTKNWDLAEDDFLKALSLSPEQPLVLNYLGYSWLEQRINLDAAKDMIQKAVKLRPNDGYIVDSLGWAYYRLGDFEKASLYLERAAELMPSDPIINDHLGDAFWETGRFIEARYQWNRAIILGASEDAVDIIRNKLVREPKIDNEFHDNGL